MVTKEQIQNQMIKDLGLRIEHLSSEVNSSTRRIKEHQINIETAKLEIHELSQVIERLTI